MKKREDDSLDKLIEYLETWLSTNEANQSAVRPLTDLLDLFRWAKETLDSMPSEMTSRFDYTPFRHDMDETYLWVVNNVPQQPIVSFTAIASTSASSTGITSNLLFGMSGAVVSGRDRSWLTGRYEDLAGIQEKQERLQKTRGLVQHLGQQTNSEQTLLEEYDLMIEKAFYYRGTELDKNVSAGVAMRNLLEHYKGRVLSIARTHPKENMTFQRALSRLSIYGEGTMPYVILVKQTSTWSNLHTRLSDLAKNRTRSDLKQLAVELIAHIYTVLSLIDRSRAH